MEGPNDSRAFKHEAILIEFDNIFARHRFNNGLNQEFTVKLTSKDNWLAYKKAFRSKGASSTLKTRHNYNTVALKFC